MDTHKTRSPGEFYKITCKNYPSEFILDKNLAKEYFRQFGKLKRLTFKPKLRICTVEYGNREGYMNALANSGDYNGVIFQVSGEKPTEPKKKIPKLVNTEPIWIDDDDVSAELAAMSGFAPKSYSLSTLPVDSGEASKVPKLKRSWTSETPLNVKKKPKKATHGELSKYMELVNVIKSQATTVEEKYKVLDARDKLIRIKLKTRSKLKQSPTVGMCPDMCPEKERLMRETKHQVALYEQEDNGRAMNPHKAIKQYSRSSADQESPLPHELRPVSVLQMTMSYLMHNIVNMCETSDVNIGEWFHFLWDRTRGIRKDITQQELCGQGAVELVEQCARFHIHCSARLVGEDPSVFDQKINTENLTKCLQSLKYMYNDLRLKGERCPNEAEFRAYVILLNLNDGNFMWEVQELREEIQKSREVKFALQVYSAIDKNNYVKFFKLVYTTTYLNACVLMRYFVQVRITAIKTLLKCYTSRAFKAVYPLEELRRVLAFDDLESTADFMGAYGLTVSEDKSQIMLDKNVFTPPETPYVLERSLNVVEVKRECSVGRMVCGRDLPDKSFENHVPQDSFDQRGFLVYDGLLEESDFVEKVEESVEIPVKTAESSVFQQPVKEISSGSIFGQTRREDVPKLAKRDVFSQPVEVQKPLFAIEPVSSIFGGSSTIKTDPVTDETDSSLWSAPRPSIFAAALQKAKTAPSGQIPASFEKKPAPQPFKTAPPATEPKKGGFHFEIPTPQVPQAPVPPQSEMEQEKLKLLEQKRKKQEEERKKRQREEEESRKRAEEAEKRRQKEEDEKRRKREEEETLRRLAKKRKQEEELKKRMEAIRKEEEDNRRDKETRNVVGSVLRAVVDKVDRKIREERLGEIRKNLRKRLVLKVCDNWRKMVVKNKRKRKAMDCMEPAWVNTKTLEQSAQDLHTASQELTLKLRKRYKYGKAFDIEIEEEGRIDKINLFQLTYAVLNRRCFNFKGVLQKNIYWKVEISLPDHYELRDGLNRIEETLKDSFGWKDRNGTVMSVEQTKPNAVQSVTYCVERQRGLFVRYGDANGIIFVAKDFNALLQRRILENLKNLGVFVKVPIVVILQERGEDDLKLQALIEEQIVSDYVILTGNLSPKSLVSLVEEGLVFLANRVEEPPPLLLDTVYAFLGKYLCAEIWKKANSFAKWNSHYKSGLREPKIVLSLYNEALSRLRKIALNESCSEFATFPEVFKDYLPSEIPDSLPCDFRYFPKFWKSDTYLSELGRVFDAFTLPSWPEKWPPSNEFDLEVAVSKYCTKAFTEPEKPFYRVMGVLLRTVDPNSNFKDIKNVLWTEVVEVLAAEKLRQAVLSLTGTVFETKSVFNQFVVVYNAQALEEYSKSDWFYVAHPMIKKFVQQSMRYEDTEKRECSEVRLGFDVSVDLDKTVVEVTKQLENQRNTSGLRKELEEFHAMMEDLETSIRIHRRISARIEENLKKAIADG